MNCLTECCGLFKWKFFSGITNECIANEGETNASINNRIQNYLITNIRRNINRPMTDFPSIDFEAFLGTIGTHVNAVYHCSVVKERQKRISDTIQDACKAAIFSAIQVLRRAQRDFNEPVRRLKITSADFHHHSVPWIVTVGQKCVVYKPRSLEIDAMIVKVFEKINLRFQSPYNLSTHNIECKRDNEGHYGYADFVDGVSYHTGTTGLTGLLKPFYENLIQNIKLYSIEEDNIQSQAVTINYMLLEQVGIEFGLSHDWHHENLIFNEETLKITAIDLEVVDISKPGLKMLDQHLSNQINEYGKKEFGHKTENQVASDHRIISLRDKINKIQKYANTIYQGANLNVIKRDFFDQVRSETPIIRFVPLGTADFYDTMWKFTNKDKVLAIFVQVKSGLEKKGFHVDEAIWNQDFVREKIINRSGLLDIPIFHKNDRIEGQNTIEDVYCENENIATRST